MLRRLLWAAVLVVGCVATARAQTQSSVGIKVGTDANLATVTRTQGGGPVHEEVVINQYDLTAKVEKQVTATSSSVALFASPQLCQSLVLKADPTNGGPVYLRRQSGVTTANGFPIYAGEWHQMSPPLVTDQRDCAGFFVIEGSGCGGTCKVYLFTN